MNGLHDMGGWHGFGAVEVEADEPVFHTRWESRVFGMAQALPGGNVDLFRHALERLDPVTYLRHGYYGRWLATMEMLLGEFGVLAPDEVEARMRSPRPRGVPAPAAWTPPVPAGFVRPAAQAPRFRLGGVVRTRNHQPRGHTRLPAYARCRNGTIVRVHGAMVYPDDHAHGRGENPQHLYTVRFEGAELWGAAAETATAVHLDLFEPYLESA